MIEHIVKNNESLYEILNTYHISVDELKQHNSHITDFNRLVSGTKLLIPLINEEVEQILDKTEGFVMDYYPKITDDIIPRLEESKPATIKEEKADSKPVEVREEANYRTPYPGILPPRNPYKGR